VPLPGKHPIAISVDALLALGGKETPDRSAKKLPAALKGSV
jgi:hypothetical protein